MTHVTRVPSRSRPTRSARRSTGWPFAALVAAALVVFSGVAGLPAQAASTATGRVAEATLLETKGDTAGAESVLRAALGSQLTQADRAQVEAALRGLLQRTGRGTEALAKAAAAAPQDPTPASVAADPIQRLIATLEEGNADDAKVKAARAQLESLGTLAIPHLLAALPKAGPFGFRNVAQLLYVHDDPRIAPALRARLDRDPTIAASLAQDLGSMSAPIAGEVARELVKRPIASSARLAVMNALRRTGAAETEWRPLFDEVIEDRANHEWLFRVAAADETPFANLVLEGIRRHGSDAYRTHATTRLLLADPDTDEDRALAALDQAPPQQQAAMALLLVEVRPQWTRVALRALPAAHPVVNQPWFARVQWWRRPTESAAALLALPEQIDPRGNEIQAALTGITSTGWRAPRELDAALQAFTARHESVTVLVRALPEGDEARARAAWEQLPPSWRFAFVDDAVRQQRPWHRIVVAQLAAAKSADEARTDWLNLDWDGAAAETIATLAEAVARRASSRDEQANSVWQGAAVAAYKRAPETLSPVVVALVRIGSSLAFQALCAHEPARALAEAGALRKPSMNDLRAVADVLVSHGDASHVPFAAQWYARFPSSNSTALPTFLAQHGAGRLEVIALGRPGMDSNTVAVARRAAQGVRVESFAGALGLVPSLDQDVAAALLTRLGQLKRPEHAAAVRAAIAAELQRRDAPEERQLTPDQLVATYAQWLGEIGSDADLPVLRQLLTAGDAVARAAAHATLAVARTDRREVLGEILQSADANVMRVAWSKDLRDDDTLRELATAGVLRHAAAWTGQSADGNRIDSAPFDAFGPRHAPALATMLLGHPDAATFHSALLTGALQALSATKDGTHVDAIARAAAHPHGFVRVRAAVELGNTFAETAVPALLDLLKDRDATVRNAAQKSLDQIGGYLEARAKWKHLDK